MNTLNFDILNRTSQLIEPVAKEYALQEFNAYKALYKEKSGNPESLIMIYGMYSHGKSTLVNALLGKEVAKMDITPTTSAPDKYKWDKGDCYLLDTPGISAKQEHTLIAANSSQKNELVVFVVESGSFEGNVVWNEIITLISKGQKTCLIINDFDNCMHDVERSERLKDNFRQHLQKTAKQANLQDIDVVAKVPLLFVNAKLALRGRLENRPELIKHSGIYEVENLLIEMVKSINVDDIIATLKRNLLHLINLCRISMASKSGDELLQLAEEQLYNIKLARDDAFTKIEGKLSDCLEFYKNEIRSVYENYGNDKEELQNALSKIVEKIAQEIQETIQSQIEKAAKKIQELCADFDKLRVKIAPEILQDNVNSDNPAVLDAVANLNWSQMLNALNWETFVQESIVTVLKQLKTWFPSFFVGKADKTFAAWAGTFTKYLGPVVTIGTILYQLYNEHAAEKKAIEEAERRNSAINDAVENTLNRLKEAFIKQISECFDNIFENLIDKLSNEVKKLQQENTITLKQQEKLNTAEQLLLEIQ